MAGFLIPTLEQYRYLRRYKQRRRLLEREAAAAAAAAVPSREVSTGKEKAIIDPQTTTSSNRIMFHRPRACKYYFYATQHSPMSLSRKDFQEDCDCKMDTVLTTREENGRESYAKRMTAIPILSNEDCPQKPRLKENEDVERDDVATWSNPCIINTKATETPSTSMSHNEKPTNDAVQYCSFRTKNGGNQTITPLDASIKALSSSPPRNIGIDMLTSASGRSNKPILSASHDHRPNHLRVEECFHKHQGSLTTQSNNGLLSWTTTEAIDASQQKPVVKHPTVTPPNKTTVRTMYAQETTTAMSRMDNVETKQKSSITATSEPNNNGQATGGSKTQQQPKIPTSIIVTCCSLIEESGRTPPSPIQSPSSLEDQSLRPQQNPKQDSGTATVPATMTQRQIQFPKQQPQQQPTWSKSPTVSSSSNSIATTTKPWFQKRKKRVKLLLQTRLCFSSTN